MCGYSLRTAVVDIQMEPHRQLGTRGVNQSRADQRGMLDNVSPSVVRGGVGVNAIPDTNSVREPVEDTPPGTPTLKGWLKGRRQRTPENRRSRQERAPSGCQKCRQEAWPTVSNVAETGKSPRDLATQKYS